MNVRPRIDCLNPRFVRSSTSLVCKSSGSPRPFLWHDFRILIVAAVGFVALTVGCTSSKPDSTTSPFGVSGVASVTGRVLDKANGAPLDSFQVGGGVLGGLAMYYAQTSVSNTSGRFTMRVERVGSSPPYVPDSVLLIINTQSLRQTDRRADGSPRRASDSVWIRFAEPSKTPFEIARDLRVPD